MAQRRLMQELQALEKEKWVTIEVRGGGTLVMVLPGGRH